MNYFACSSHWSVGYSVSRHLHILFSITVQISQSVSLSTRTQSNVPYCIVHTSLSVCLLRYNFLSWLIKSTKHIEREKEHLKPELHFILRPDTSNNAAHAYGTLEHVHVMWRIDATNNFNGSFNDMRKWSERNQIAQILVQYDDNVFHLGCGIFRSNH